MPRKFLGERLDAHLDFVRPASLGVTSSDLNKLPDAPRWNSKIESETDNSLTSASNGRRISRAFGGTVKLKKRLSSVPELLIHELEQLERKAAVNLKPRVSRRIPPVKNDAPDESPLPKMPMLQRPAMKQKSLIRTHFRPAVTNNQTHVSSPLAGPPIINTHTNVLAYPVMTADMSRTPLTRKKSVGEILFDEILTAYGCLPEDQRKKVPSIVSKNFDDSSSRRWNNSFQAAKKHSHLDFHPNIHEDGGGDSDTQTAIRHEFETSALGDSLPNPYYSNSSGSDPSSSGEEFSDIGSIMSSLKSPHSVRTTDDDESATYYSADDNVSRSSKLGLPSPVKSRYSLRHVRTSKVIPQIFELGDLSDDSTESEDDEKVNCISQLQEELMDLDIMDASSSIYDD
ncbi:LAME_0H02652g1_1 [Lachancea meyersii CBS 8951]|uniref:LAME_0H02652g1_1 n=1 Tax=Lachancea meyersii CBS 8951 TaxID=1266667 RepID=A0A1G4KDK3_9SACH|nr:LAME_0H02652g1_1 [Lachancea meyersii CBS 8951]